MPETPDVRERALRETKRWMQSTRLSAEDETVLLWSELGRVLSPFWLGRPGMLCYAKASLQKTEHAQFCSV